MIYTAGYHYLTPQMLLNFCDGDALFSTKQQKRFEIDPEKYVLPALVVDVRYSAYSRRKEWTGTYLAELFGARYMGITAFGNVNYRTGDPQQIQIDNFDATGDPQQIQIDNFDAGVEMLNARRQPRQPVILLCGCANASECHRTTLVELFRSRGRRSITHIELT